MIQTEDLVRILGPPVEPADAAEKDPGIFTPLPMCVDPNTCPKCAACIESSSFCQGCGKKCGVSHTDPCRVPRHKLMFFATFVSVEAATGAGAAQIHDSGK